MSNVDLFLCCFHVNCQVVIPFFVFVAKARSIHMSLLARLLCTPRRCGTISEFAIVVCSRLLSNTRVCTGVCCVVNQTDRHSNGTEMILEFVFWRRWTCISGARTRDKYYLFAWIMATVLLLHAVEFVHFCHDFCSTIIIHKIQSTQTNAPVNWTQQILCVSMCVTQSDSAYNRNVNRREAINQFIIHAINYSFYESIVIHTPYS